MQATKNFKPSNHIPISPTHGHGFGSNQFRKPDLVFNFNPALASTLSFSLVRGKFCSFVSSTESTTPFEVEPQNPIPEAERFNWFSQWYPVMPISDLDKRVPQTVMGLDIVVWFDRNDNAWKVFNDTCPHRLAPLSEGRIDQLGRLQCVYHGWCFNGSGDCKFIPQAPIDGPSVHTSKKACVAVYPSTVQNDIVWFWPNTDPEFKDILMKKKPPFIPELDDPIYTNSMNNRDLPYGYEVLNENFMDPAHSPYAHYGLLPQPKNSLLTLTNFTKASDREGGRPMELSVTSLDINGFTGKQEWGINEFIAPCIFCAYPSSMVNKGNKSSQGNETGGTSEESANVPKRKALLIFICIPVSPGKSRLIWTFPRNYGSWVNRITPRWMFHLRQNLLLDSDLYLLHVEERKIFKKGASNWQKSCFLPTKSDSLVIAFRTWLHKYSDGQVNWGSKYTEEEDLYETPPREQLLDRYRSHVVNCRSCSAAYKTLSAVEIAMQIISIASIGIVVARQSMLSVAARSTLVCMAILFFAASRWLSHFIYKNFNFHNYNHAII